MGYYANAERGERIFLPPETHDKIWTEALPKCEAVLGDHISWCSPLSDYEATGAPVAERIRQVLNDYGFDPVIVDDDGNVVIHGWGGDKLGSCWDKMWSEVIAPHTRTDLTWVMRGEDNDIWAHVVRNHVLQEFDIFTILKTGKEVIIL